MNKYNVAEPVTSVKTAAEFDLLVEEYAKTNPSKHAAKVASGEFAKQRLGLIGGEVPVTSPEKGNGKTVTDKV